MRKLLLFALTIIVLAACSETVETPKLPDLTEGQWNQFKPAGDTTCSDGSEFSYYVYPGTVNKLVVEFIGGGACWNHGTCAEDPTFSQTINEDVYLAGSDVGIYNHNDARNPVKDWFHVVVPYCTGDIHWGDASVDYVNPDNQEEITTVQHKGAVNARAVLDWVYAEFEAPKDIFVTGCSAGAYGSALWAPHINQQFSSSNLYQLGDSGAGIVTQDFVDNGLSQWNVEPAFPSFIPALDPNLINVNSPTFLETIYAESSLFFPNSTFSQYNTSIDGTQIGFYGLMKGEGFPSNETLGEWTVAMPASQTAIAAKASNFNYFIDNFDDDDNQLNGTAHCIINRDAFYTTAVGETSLISWLEDMVTGQGIENISILGN